MTTETNIVLTKRHKRGFGFGCISDNGEWVYIPPFMMKKLDIRIGMSAHMVIVPNTEPGRCVWKAVAMSTDIPMPTNDNMPLSPETVAVSGVLSDGEPWTAADIAAEIEADMAAVHQALASLSPYRIQLTAPDGTVKQTYYLRDRNAAVDIIEGIEG